MEMLFDYYTGCGAYEEGHMGAGVVAGWSRGNDDRGAE